MALHRENHLTATFPDLLAEGFIEPAFTAPHLSLSRSPLKHSIDRELDDDVALH
jgi:hypothetical protein